MKFIRALTVAALFAALFVLALPAQADCGDGDPTCLLEPPVSVEIRTASTSGDASVTTAESGALTPLDFAVPMPLPRRVEAPLVSAQSEIGSTDSIPDFTSLSIPMRYQATGDVSCGVQALGMALDGIDGSAPTSNALLGFLQDQGMMYNFGTGVEELAHAAQNFGYSGSLPFHGWSLDQLSATLAGGKPVVVALGANGDGEPGHFVAVTGVSPDGHWVTYNDPTLGKQVISAEEFERLWGLQGSSGVFVAKSLPAGAPADYAPWVALAAGLMALVSTTPLALQRKGIGGMPTAPGGGSNSSSPPYAAPAGKRWTKKTVTKYDWKDVTFTEKVEVPNIVRTWAVVRVNRWIEKVPVYKTVKVDRGRWAYRTVKKYRTERYRTSQRYRVKKSYWYRRNGRFYRGSRYVWKTRTVVKTRRVSYTKRERYWVPKIVQEQRFVRNREIEHRDPVYGWRDEKHGTKMASVTKTVPKWMPVGKEEKWELENLPEPPPTPTPTPDTTPTPTFTPNPERPPTPEVTGTPFPVSISPSSPFLTIDNTSLIGKAVKRVIQAKNLWSATGLAYNELPTGYYSVSAPLKEAGDKLAFRVKDQFIPGTRYTSRGLASASGSSLLKKWAKGLRVSLGIPVVVNLVDYGIGEHSDVGVVSNEFAASTMVDMAYAGLTGIAAAGVVAGGAAFLGGVLGIAAIASAPLWATALVAAGLGIAFGAIVDHMIDTDELKRNVTDGLGTLPGILENAGTIISVGTQKVSEAVVETIDSVVNAGKEVGEAVIDTAQEVGAAVSKVVSNAADSVLEVAQTVALTVSNTVQNATDTITEFVGGLFGGGD
jgi:hypothetical protein